MNINDLTDRKQQIRSLPAPRQYVKQRMAKAAEELNRAGDMAACVEIANEVLTKFAHLLYIKDGDGAFANVDNRNGRLLVPAPWGSLGWKIWGLRNWEAVVLRCVLLGRVEDRTRPSLFDYNAPGRTWHLNLSDYPTLQAGSFYLDRGAVKLTEWRHCATQYHDSRVKIQARYRERGTKVK